MNGHIYIRPSDSGWLCGGFELKAKAVPFDDELLRLRNDWMIKEDWDHFCKTLISITFIKLFLALLINEIYFNNFSYLTR